MSKNFYPKNLVLRCYAHPIPGGRYYGMCIDLDLAAEADSAEALQSKLNEMIVSYFETVLDTRDKGSIPDLLTRRAPIMDWVKYYSIALLVRVTEIGRFTFKASIPFHLENHCYGR